MRAFEELVARFEGPLFHFLHLRTRDAAAAEELAQDAFLRAWQRLERYDPRWRFSTWLFTLAKRLSASRARSRTRDETREPAVEPAIEADPAALAETRELRQDLWSLAARVLRVEEHSALWLRYGEDRSVEEIARILGRPRVSVRVLLFRARERLARHLPAPENTRAPCDAPQACDTMLQRSGVPR